MAYNLNHLVRVPLGEGVGALPPHQVRRFVSWLRRKWPEWPCELTVVKDGPGAPWAGIRFAMYFVAGVLCQASVPLTERVFSYLRENRVDFQYDLYWGIAGSFEEDLALVEKQRAEKQEKNRREEEKGRASEAVPDP